MFRNVDTGAISNCHKTVEVLLQNGAVAKMTVCVTFGAPRFGPKYCNICIRSEYATFCTISAIAVREMTVCVTFGAIHFGFLVATWRRPVVDYIGGVAHGSVISGIAVSNFVFVGGVWHVCSYKWAMVCSRALSCDRVVVVLLLLIWLHLLSIDALVRGRVFTIALQP